MNKNLRKIILNGIICSTSTLILVLGIQLIGNAAVIPQPSENFSTITTSTQNNNYIQTPGTNTTAAINQPRMPYQFPIKSVYANYVRDDKITRKTTKIFVVMDNGNSINLPTDATSVRRKTNNIFMNLYSTGGAVNERGTSYSKENPIDSKFLDKTNINANQILGNLDFVGSSSIGFTANRFYELLAPDGNGGPIMNSSDLSTIYNLGPKVELVDVDGKRQVNYTNYMYGLSASVITVTPTINGLKVGDKTISGTGQQVGDTITVTKNGASIGTTTVDGSGNWSVQISSALINNDKITVTETSAVPGDKSGSATGIVTLRTDLPVNVYPVALATKQINGYGSQPGATVAIFPGFTSTQQTTTVDANGNWELPISSADRIWDTGYSITITDAVGNTGTTNFRPFGIKSIADIDFGQINLANISDYNKLIPLSSWGGVTFMTDISKAGPWAINIYKISDFGSNIKLVYGVDYGNGQTNTEITSTSLRFMNNKPTDARNSVVAGDTAKLSAKANLYLDISQAKGLLKQGNYQASYNLSLVNAPY